MSSKNSFDSASDHRKQDLIEAYDRIHDRVQQAAQARTGSQQPRLVAVSKLKPPGDILALYEHGVRHFGENYPQELAEKAKQLPQDIQWHFIGALQSNKAKMLASIPNLFAIETLTSIKAANHLHTTLQASSSKDSTDSSSSSSSPATNSKRSRLNVYLQLNTSSETSKAGLNPEGARDPSSESELVNLATHVLVHCHDTLCLRGLMTIGSIEASKASDEHETNPDFATLAQAARDLVKTLRLRTKQGEPHGLESSDDRAKLSAGLDEIESRAPGGGGAGGLELSMGMSDDFEIAIKQGSDNVRVGSSIFGARPPRQSATGAA